MATLVCPNCGTHFAPAEPKCPACGVRPHRPSSPAVWPPSPARRAALLFGLLIALLIVGALVWAILAGRRSLLESPSPIFPSTLVETQCAGCADPAATASGTGRK
ncbi:MAG TPA: hypothetical protein VHG28_09295 [Longimicrobiaceae bacterium]|nr:hypothetical protein [Longimicrobiaceae bacterium]